MGSGCGRSASGRTVNARRRSTRSVSKARLEVSVRTFTITGTSPAAAGQAALSGIAQRLEDYDSFYVTALLVGATGGTLDVYLQRRVTDDGSVWADWIHFPQLAAGAAAIKYNASSMPPAVATATVIGTTADNGTSGAPALAANTVLGGHPGEAVRCVCVAGASTSAGAAVTIHIKGRRGPR